MAYDKNKSKTVLIVFFRDGNERTFYSNYRKDYKHDYAWIENAKDMVKRLLIFKWKGKYTTAVLYNNDTGKTLQRWRNDELLENCLG